MLPTLELRIIGWEIKRLLDKDDDGNVILVDGKPTIFEEWVILQVALGRDQFPMEMELEDFERAVLPKVLDPCIRFWRSVEVGNPLFPKRAAMLEKLLKTKEEYPHISEP